MSENQETFKTKSQMLRDYHSWLASKGGKASAKTVDTVERARKAGKAGGRGRGKK